MNCFKVHALVGVLLVLCGGMFAAGAETVRPGEDFIPSPAPSPGAPAQPVGPSAGALTAQDLQAALETLGYQPQTFKSPQGGYSLVRIQSGKWTYVVSVHLSPNKRKVWLMNNATKLDPGQQIPAEIMTKLLNANLRWGPAHFTYNPQTRTLGVGVALDNRNVSLGDLRQELDFLVRVINETAPLWNKQSWPVTGAVAGN